MSSRMKFLMGGLFLTVVAVIFAPDPNQDVVASAITRPVKISEGEASHKVTASKGNADALMALRPREGGLRVGALFNAPKVQVAVLPVPVIAEVEHKLPPLPFKVLGKYEDGKGRAVFLDDKGQGIVVREGDLLREETYRVSGITDDEVRITYMPLQKIQTLALGDTP